jgi:hypothetical protein
MTISKNLEGREIPLASKWEWAQPDLSFAAELANSENPEKLAALFNDMRSWAKTNFQFNAALNDGRLIKARGCP